MFYYSKFFLEKLIGKQLWYMWSWKLRGARC